MMHPMLSIAINAARQASKIILRYVDQMDKITITQKSLNDFVTQADTLSEEIIISTIQKAYPRHGILAEESIEINPGADFTWIIDPLDGTRNFIHSFPQFAISIAVMKKNQIEIGVVYDPIRQELFTATRGQGAYLNSRRMRVSDTKKMAASLIGTGFPCCDKNKDIVKKYVTTFENILLQCSDIRRTGAAALDLAYVAAGRLDGFWESNLKIWDVAAASLMIKEAGGSVTDFSGGNQYLAGSIVAGNLKIHKEVLSHLVITQGE